MLENYTEVPQNIADILPYIQLDKSSIVSEIYAHRKCIFYDTCSFRRHANMKSSVTKKLLKYFQDEDGILVITRCILMELASHSGVLHQKYIDYIKLCAESGLTVLLIYEEDVVGVLEECFSTNAVINRYLCWTLRLMRLPVSTITDTLEQEEALYDAVIRGKNLERGGLFADFFTKVRKNKESGDNLGEELLAICLHLLSYLPGEEDGKFCMITDDKGAAGKIDALFQKTDKKYRGKKIILYSTPKLAQILYRENLLQEKDEIETMLKAGTEGNVVVLGTCIYDIRNRVITMPGEEMAELMMEPNGIHIVF